MAAILKILLNLNFWGLLFIVLGGYLDNFPEKFSFLHFVLSEKLMLLHYKENIVVHYTLILFIFKYIFFLIYNKKGECDYIFLINGGWATFHKMRNTV